MLREIGTEINLGKTISPFNSIGSSSAIDRTAPVFLNASQNVQKKKNKNLLTQNMMLTLQNIYLERSSLSIKECLDILTQNNRRQTFCTKTWEIWNFKYC